MAAVHVRHHAGLGDLEDERRRGQRAGPAPTRPRRPARIGEPGRGDVHVHRERDPAVRPHRGHVPAGAVEHLVVQERRSDRCARPPRRTPPAAPARAPGRSTGPAPRPRRCWRSLSRTIGGRPPRCHRGAAPRPAGWAGRGRPPARSALARSAPPRRRRAAWPRTSPRRPGAAATRPRSTGPAHPAPRARCWRRLTAAWVSAGTAGPAPRRRGRRPPSSRGHSPPAPRTRRRPAGRRCRRPGPAAQPLADLPQQHVAGRVPERVVDELEVVEIDEQQADRAPVVPVQVGRVASRSPNSVRLGRPVSGSWKAWYATLPGRAGPVPAGWCSPAG